MTTPWRQLCATFVVALLVAGALALLLVWPARDIGATRARTVELDEPPVPGAR
jgi:hypothetical protein